MAKSDEVRAASEESVAKASENRDKAALAAAAVDVPDPNVEDPDVAVVKAVCDAARRAELGQGESLKIVVQREGLRRVAADFAPSASVAVDRKQGAVALWRRVPPE